MTEVALGTLITYNPQTIASFTPVDEALRLMNDLDVHHLPVVDERNRIVGIVSHRDLCSMSTALTARFLDDVPSNERRTVERVMIRSVISMDANCSPVTALRAILSHGFHSVPILEDGQLVGMITSTDFLRELSYGQWSVAEDRVADHMLALSHDELLFSAATATDALVEESSVVAPHQTLATAAALMLEFSVREIAVFDEQGNPVGVLRDDDVLQAIAGSIS